MFGFFTSRKKKNAKALISLAYKVYNYRRDMMSEKDAADMLAMIDEIEGLVNEGKIGSKEYEGLSEKLEKLMRKCGGTIYPLSGWADTVDTIVVVGILVIGVRSFFLQPFKIPTNSMYPTFYGMTSEVFTPENPPPSFPEKIARAVFKGASNYSLTAPESGELLVEINNMEAAKRQGGIFAFDTLPVRKYFVWPSTERKYNFAIGGQNIDLWLPADFSLDTVITKAFPVNGIDDLYDYIQEASKNDKIVKNNGRYYLKLGNFKKGETMLDFDILGGDMLFVDRVTYNFKKPEVGDAIVFKTKYVDGMTRLNHGVPDDKYYIKRLVGVGADTLKVEDDTLFINGAPATGSVAFEKNSKREGDYSGYRQEGAFSNGGSVKISDGHYYAMGDNSANSFDSRYWGEVPQHAVVGKSLIIFYPFTKRWGASK